MSAQFFPGPFLCGECVDDYQGIYGNVVEGMLIVTQHFGMHLIGALGVEDDHNDHNYTSSSHPLHLLTAYHTNINIEPNYKIFNPAMINFHPCHNKLSPLL